MAMAAHLGARMVLWQNPAGSGGQPPPGVPRLFRLGGERRQPAEASHAGQAVVALAAAHRRDKKKGSGHASQISQTLDARTSVVCLTHSTVPGIDQPRLGACSPAPCWIEMQALAAIESSLDRAQRL